MTALTHYTAFRTQLDGGILAGKVYSSIRLNGAEYVRANYVVAYPATPDRLSDGRLTAVQRAVSRARYRYDVRYVAVDPEGVLMLAQAGRERLVGARLTVPGRSLTSVRVVEDVEEGSVLPDRTAGLFYLTDTFEFWSDPA